MQIELGSYYGVGFIVDRGSGDYLYLNNEDLRLSRSTIEKIESLLAVHKSFLNTGSDYQPKRQGSVEEENAFWSYMDDVVERVKTDLPATVEIVAVLDPEPDPFKCG